MELPTPCLESPTTRRARGALVGALALASLMPAAAAGHPLGNFSVNHHAALRIGGQEIEIAYVVDMAEIPSFQEIQEHGLVPDAADPSIAPYLSRAAARLGEGLRVEVNGARRPLSILARDIAFPPGAGDLPTLRLRAVYQIELDEGASHAVNELRYRDDNFPGRAGWKEIMAVARPGARLASSSVGEVDRSRALSDYPTDLLNSPPQDLEARVVFAASPTPAGAVSRPAPHGSPPDLSGRPASRLAGRHGLAPREPSGRGRGRDEAAAPPDAGTPAPALLASEEPRAPASVAVASATPRSTFTQLMAARELSLGVVFLAVITALGAGAVHALEPGHGKTIVAAYLVGARGTARHALLLGLAVTASHTTGVFLLGLVTLYASRYMVPERLYPWLGAASGLIIAGLGFWLLLRRVAGGGYPGHEHDEFHGHVHGDSETGQHDHGPGEDAVHRPAHPRHPHSHRPHHHGCDHHHHDVPASLRELLTLGVTGGIVPCPAALVVLLSAIALRRTGFGLLLIAAFSVGLASVLVGIGLLMVYARRFMARVPDNGPMIRRWLPLASAAAIMLLGVGIAVQALMAAGIVQIRA